MGLKYQTPELVPRALTLSTPRTFPRVFPSPDVLSRVGILRLRSSGVQHLGLA